MEAVMTKQTGFQITVTLRTRAIAKDDPGQIFQFQSVMIQPSIVKAFQEAIASCPNDKEIMAISLSEIPVFGVTDPSTP